MGAHPRERESTPLRKFLRVAFRSSVIAFLMCVTLGIGACLFFINGVSKANIPSSPTSIGEMLPIKVLASDRSTVLAEIQPEGGTREIVEAHQISEHMKTALINAEDGSFESNIGFDPIRTGVAVLGHLSGDSSAGGASTITQQLIKNTVGDDEYSVNRKWEELLSSVRLTSEWTKDDIISSYLNVVYFGRGAIGIEKAAQVYFGVHASELSIEQSALLAGVIQSPSRWDPLVDSEGAQFRFDYVVGQMLKNGVIDEKQASSMKIPQTLNTTNASISFGIDDANGYITSMALAELDAQGMDIDYLHSSGAEIVTTIDPYAQGIIHDKARSAKDTHDISVGISAISPTGAIRGMYAGENGTGFNYATSPQMTGSAFKIFTLASALENGIGLDTPISSAPYISYGGVEIGNSDGMSCGNCSMAEATKMSLNTSFYRIQDMLPHGSNTTRETAQKMGVDAPLSEEDGSVNPGITLGVYGSSPVQMANAMATLANNGQYNHRYIVESVFTNNGQIIYNHSPMPAQVISPETVAGVDAALEPIAAYSNGNQLSGKTGYLKTGTVQHGSGQSTGANRDALAVGYTRNMGIAVWTGKDDGSPLVDAYGSPIWGAGVPSTLWREILNEIG